jgi:hypothetical protein
MRTGSPAAMLLLSVSAILFPLFLPGRVFAFFPLMNGLLLLILIVLIGIVTGQFVYLGIVSLLGAGLTVARLVGLMWIPGRLTAGLAFISGIFAAWQLRPGCISTKSGALAPVVTSFFSYWKADGSNASKQRKLAPGICGLVLICALIETIPTPSRLWHPIVGPSRFLAAWREIQYWAKDNTSLETKFLVPPFPVGFRIFSERTSWVDWKDGDAVYSLPEYATEWRRRLHALGIQLVVGDLDPTRMAQQYKQQSWERLVTFDRYNDINYIIQYTEVQHDVSPIFMNEKFAVYRVFN